MTRGITLILGLAGAALAGFTGQSVDAALGAIALAVAAGLGLSLMLRGVGLRIVGVLVTVLATIGAGLSVASAAGGQGVAWASLGGFLAVLVAGYSLLRYGPGWAALAADRPAHPKDLWKQIDEGLDPTSDESGGGTGDFETTQPDEMPPGRDSG
ncbi:MAG TPA: Trp biosynthesis-associated membrane protein [Arachnia sp.]|nr:Trp biosynthesis-associated membrane protein [Arachnia sp.]HMT85890.1 Trp biosynthesis-associated membrane protein [Arachnia sp.]